MWPIIWPQPDLGGFAKNGRMPDLLQLGPNPVHWPLHQCSEIASGSQTADIMQKHRHNLEINFGGGRGRPMASANFARQCLKEKNYAKHPLTGYFL